MTRGQPNYTNDLEMMIELTLAYSVYISIFLARNVARVAVWIAAIIGSTFTVAIVTILPCRLPRACMLSCKL